MHEQRRGQFGRREGAAGRGSTLIRYVHIIVVGRSAIGISCLHSAARSAMSQLECAAVQRRRRARQRKKETLQR